MKVAIYIGLIFSVSNAFAHGEHIYRKDYIDTTIGVDQNNVPVEKKTFYFPVDFFPQYKLSRQPIDSTSFLIGKMWFNMVDSIETQDTIFTYSTALPETVDTLHLEWFSEQLFALNEPLLFNNETNKETYRFTWLRTFDNPISLRIEKEESEIWIYTKVGSGAGGYPPETIKSNRKKKVSISEWEEFIGLLNEHDFWNSINHGSIPGTDGSQWIFEGSTSKKYSVINKSSVREGSALYEIGLFLIDLSNVRVRKNRIH